MIFQVDTLGVLQHAIGNVDSIQQRVLIQVVKRVAFRERTRLHWLVIDVIAEVPKHVGNWLALLQHELTASKIIREQWHLSPPCLTAQNGVPIRPPNEVPGT